MIRIPKTAMREERERVRYDYEQSLKLRMMAKNLTSTFKTGTRNKSMNNTVRSPKTPNAWVTQSTFYVPSITNADGVKSPNLTIRMGDGKTLPPMANCGPLSSYTKQRVTMEQAYAPTIHARQAEKSEK